MKHSRAAKECLVEGTKLAFRWWANFFGSLKRRKAKRKRIFEGKVGHSIIKSLRREEAVNNMNYKCASLPPWKLINLNLLMLTKNSHWGIVRCASNERERERERDREFNEPTLKRESVWCSKTKTDIQACCMSHGMLINKPLKML
jgi:hypothetical protein